MITYEEALDLLERVAERSGMRDSSASSWLSAVHKVLEQAGESERGATVDLSDAAYERQVAGVRRLSISPSTQENYIRGWKRAREFLLDYLQARDSSTETAFWDRLERRGQRRRRSTSSSTTLSSFTTDPIAVSEGLNETSGSRRREIRYHVVYVPGVGDLSIQLPDRLTAREASALVQYILERVDGDLTG